MEYTEYRFGGGCGTLAGAFRFTPCWTFACSRGVHNEKEAERFLHPDLNQMHDPYLLLGTNGLCHVIKSALERGEDILIYGDYDADGVSSTSLMIHLMRHLGASYDIYIPHRSNEGYGLHNHALDWAHQQGVSLIITVDTGISAVEQIAYAATLGIEVIVTDHHEPPEILPEAFTLINPKLPGCPILLKVWQERSSLGSSLRH